MTERWTAKRVLDAGVHGVVFPFVSTPELAQQAADACRYPPAGRRGSGASLATFSWPEPDGYYDSADRNVLVVLPPSYAKDKSRRYAVVYALHGYSIGAEQWSREIGDRQQDLDRETR